MPGRKPDLRGAIRKLRGHYGPPPEPPASDPFELVLWENVAYLSSPARRREAFELLRETIGTRPEALQSASRRDLERITALGILKSTFASKLRECGRIAVERFGGDLGSAVTGPVAEAKKALRAFPGIGEPGAEKILLFSGHRALLAPESNGLRVLVRLGLIPEEKSYARTYAAAREAASSLPATVQAMRTAHLLLQLHGRTLCRNSAPRCGSCPLEAECNYARSKGSRAKTR